MQLLRVLYYPDPKLREACKAVEPDDIPKCRQLFEELTKAMYAWDGVAIAAPQVGVSMRVIVIDLRPDTEAGRKLPRIPLVMVNPQILDLDQAGEIRNDREGCLSFPGVFVDVPRRTKVTARWLGVDGVEATQEFGGIQARAIQHELEHLDGKLLIDHTTSRMRRDIIERKMRKVAKHGGPRPKSPTPPVQP